MRVVCFVVGLGLASLLACSFEPGGMAPDEPIDAASVDAEADPDARASEDAADLDADVDALTDAPIDASPVDAAVDASPVDALVDAPACGAPGQPCCTEGPACMGLGLCVLGTCVV